VVLLCSSVTMVFVCRRRKASTGMYCEAISLPGSINRTHTMLRRQAGSSFLLWGHSCCCCCHRHSNCHSIVAAVTVCSSH
jgi:hypothetical protein